MDRINAMSVLLRAVEAGSFSKASRDLGLPLATVSRKVSELEAHLNAGLVIRSSKGLELTPAGRTYITAAKEILEQLNEAERAAAGEYTEPKGDLVVTAPIMFGRLHVLPVVTSFLDAYPEVDMGLILTDRIAHLLDDHIDLALRIGDLPDSSLTATRLGSVRKVVCASPTYIAKYGIPETPDQLLHHAAISFAGVATPSAWKFESGGSELSAPLRSRLSVNTIDAAIDAALLGAGLAQTMSYQIAEAVREGKLTVVLQKFEPPPLPVHLVYHSQSRIPLKLRAFVDFVTPRLRERLRNAAF